MKLLKFSKSNAKLSRRLIFSLPAGYTCPDAGVCRTFANRHTGNIKDDPRFDNTLSLEFRCFAAMAETRPAVRDCRWHNWDLLKEAAYATDDQVIGMASILELSLMAHAPFDLVRIHESGDFFSPVYFQAWCKVASHHPDAKFYAYTKSLQTWFQYYNQVPANLFLTASCGGLQDHLIDKHPEVFKRVAYVVYTEEEAAGRKLEIDHDDSHCFGDKPFALLVHNVQRKGSAAQKALNARRKAGSWTGYGTH